jgi:2-amino-4-hydroxy-6-hydroxymethyldihydropteridine diphosphokinase
MPERQIAYVALGANLNDPARQIETAIDELSRLPESRLLGRSGLYASDPAGYADQPEYVNAVAQLETSLAPRDLLDRLLDIERHHGRERNFRNSPRTLDLDILLYGDLALSEPGLHIPHPRMHERAFVLRPLAELAPETELRGHGRIADLAAELPAISARLIELHADRR